MSKIYHTLSRENIRGMYFPMNSVVVRLDNGMRVVCTDFHTKRIGFLKLYVWISEKNKWVLTYEKNDLTELMWEYYTRNLRRTKSDRNNYENMMKHSRKKKRASGGSRLGNNEYTTDYECAKVPLHDFRRSMYVQWNA